jgi:hypothetical protein
LGNTRGEPRGILVIDCRLTSWSPIEMLPGFGEGPSQGPPAGPYILRRYTKSKCSSSLTSVMSISPRRSHGDIDSKCGIVKRGNRVNWACVQEGSPVQTLPRWPTPHLRSAGPDPDDSGLSAGNAEPLDGDSHLLRSRGALDSASSGMLDRRGDAAECARLKFK